MTRITQFVEAFWEPEFISTRGFDKLVKRNKDGRKQCKEFEDYCKERAKAEQAYSKALQNIAKKLEDRDETGDLIKSVKQLKIETEKIGRTHEEAAVNFSKLSQELTKFNEEQKLSQKQQEDRLSRQQNEKIAKYKQTIQLRDKYMQRCKEMENAEDMFKQMQHTVTKDLTKLEKNKERCSEQKLHATQAYKSSVAHLETTRKTWEEEMEKTCKHFQHLDEERINFMRDVIWKSTNVDSKACVDHDESAENVRKMLERCDIAHDIQEFIDHNRLDGRKPPTIKFEDYDRKTPKDNNGSTIVGRPLPQPATLTRDSTINRRAAQPIPQIRSPPPRPEQPLIFFDDGQENPYHYATASPSDYSYASVDDLKGGPKNPKISFSEGKQMVVTKSYNTKEFSVTSGEMVEVVMEMPKGMIRVRNKSGREGIIPIHCITPGQATYL